MQQLQFDAMNWDATVKLAVAIATLIASAIGFTKWYLGFRSDNRAKRAEAAARHSENEFLRLQQLNEERQIAGLRAIAYILDVMKSMTQPGINICDRAIMFNGHNGGGLPDPSRPYYISAIYSETSSAYKLAERPEARYKLVPVDSQYVFTLLQSHQYGSVRLITDDMPECVLRDYYMTEGVNESIIYFVRMAANIFVFLSVARIGRRFTDAERRESNRCVQLIRAAMIDWTSAQMEAKLNRHLTPVK